MMNLIAAWDQSHCAWFGDTSTRRSAHSTSFTSSVTLTSSSKSYEITSNRGRGGLRQLRIDRGRGADRYMRNSIRGGNANPP